jgi:hypothetical protein
MGSVAGWFGWEGHGFSRAVWWWDDRGFSARGNASEIWKAWRLPSILKVQLLPGVSWTPIPQGLKPLKPDMARGTAEAVPFPNAIDGS